RSIFSAWTMAPATRSHRMTPSSAGPAGRHTGPALPRRTPSHASAHPRTATSSHGSPGPKSNNGQRRRDSHGEEGMRLSVIIPVYNEASTLRALLQRVVALPIDKEVLVVDDGSDEETVGQLQAAVA